MEISEVEKMEKKIVVLEDEDGDSFDVTCYISDKTGNIFFYDGAERKYINIGNISGTARTHSYAGDWHLEGTKEEKIKGVLEFYIINLCE